LDFGLAKRLSHEELVEATTQSQASLTQPGAVLGTLPYMAPEQLRGQGADARSDVWALGVVLHEMLSGQRPFQGQTGYELSSAILEHPPPPLPAKVPVELRAVIERCLAKEPGQRYPRAGEVRAALETLASGAAVPGLKWKYLARRRWFRTAAAAVAVVLLFSVLLGLNVGGLRERLVGPPAPKIESIAVLPLENLSGDPEQEYFVDGMHEELIATLGKVEALTVISRTSVMQYKRARKPLPEIAKELRVDAVIEGSVRQAGNQVRINVQLVDARTEKRLWAESYQRELRDVLALQSEVARAITDQLRVAITPDERVRLAATRPVNPEAYRQYLLGRHHLNKHTAEGYPQAALHFQEAIDLDRSYALGYAGLAETYLRMPALVTLRPREAYPRARAAAERALELDHALAEAHAALGRVQMNYDWDWAGSERSFRRALELNPNSYYAHEGYAWYLTNLGRHQESISEMKRAAELDPLSLITAVNVGRTYFDARRYAEAEQAARKALAMEPNFAEAHAELGRIYLASGRPEQAVAALQDAQKLSPTSAYVGLLARAYVLTGNREEGRRLLGQLERESKERYVSSSQIALIYAHLGEKDRAFQWLEKSLEERDWNAVRMKVSPAFDVFRDDPRFQGLLERAKFPEE
jgi:TolB-like protein/Tfp pilus assembly protein PilF